MLISIVFILVTSYLLFSALIYFFQDRFVYHPDKAMYQIPTLLQLDYEDVTINTKDGEQLNGWWIPHKNPRATLLFFHGNAGNISHRLESIKIFNQLGLSVFIIDYRGYGKSTGRPSEQGTYLDAEAAWLYLTDEKGIANNDIIIFGRSLGGAVASWLASHYQSAALILESSFSSIADIGKHYYPFLPVKLLLRIKYPSVERIVNANAPILIIHSPDDEIVPYALGQSLYQQAKQPKRFVDINGDHNDGFLTSGKLYPAALDQFISDFIQADDAA